MPPSQRLTRRGIPARPLERKPTWENPEESIGDFCRCVGKNQLWHAQGPAREMYLELSAEVKTYLERNLEPPTREVQWSLYMAGRTPRTARPVLMFISEDRKSRQTARTTIKESGILPKYPGVDTADCSQPPDFGQFVRLASDDGKSAFMSDVVGDTVDREYTILYEPGKSLLGSPIFVAPCDERNSLTKKATIGVIVKWCDSICFLTAAHVFDESKFSTPMRNENSTFECDIDGELDEEDEEEKQFVEATSRWSMSLMSATSNESTTALDLLLSRTGSGLESDESSADSTLTKSKRKRSNSGSESLASLTGDDQIDESASNFNDGIELIGKKNITHDFVYTTPERLVQCYFPPPKSPSPRVQDPESMGKSKLLLSSLDGPHHNLDYALIEIDEKIVEHSRINILDDAKLAHLNLSGIAVLESQDEDVIVVTGSSGLLKGRILGTATYTTGHFPRETKFTRMWTVQFRGVLANGDCGSCVFNAHTGRLYGHIVSGNPETGYAYIVPAVSVWEDIRSRFGIAPLVHERMDPVIRPTRNKGTTSTLYQCVMCYPDIEFYSQRSFRRHMSRMHFPEKFFYCPVETCQFVHVRLNKFHQHFKSMHGSIQDLIAKPRQRINPDFALTCLNCGEHKFQSWKEWFSHYKDHCRVDRNIDDSVKNAQREEHYERPSLLGRLSSLFDGGTNSFHTRREPDELKKESMISADLRNERLAALTDPDDACRAFIDIVGTGA